MAVKKILGWVLVGVGLAIIAIVLYLSFNIFTGKANAPEIFKNNFGKATAETSKPAVKLSVQEELQNQMQKTIEGQIGKLLPIEFLMKILNLFAWSVFATIMFFGGGKISGIGIAILKD